MLPLIQPIMTDDRVGLHWLLASSCNMYCKQQVLTRKKNVLNKNDFISGSAASILIFFYILSIVCPTVLQECNAKPAEYLLTSE